MALTTPGFGFAFLRYLHQHRISVPVGRTCPANSPGTGSSAQGQAGHQTAGGHFLLRSFRAWVLMR